MTDTTAPRTRPRDRAQPSAADALLAELARDVDAWSGDPAEGDTLKQRTRALPVRDLRGGADELQRGILRLAGLYAKPDDHARQVQTQVRKDARLVLFVGDPDLARGHSGGLWPYAHWRRIDEAHAIPWLELFASTADRLTVDDAMRTFVSAMFRVRPRAAWVPAARAMAALGLRNTEIRAEIARLWSTCFPPEVGSVGGLPESWASEPLSGRLRVERIGNRLGETDGADAVHLARHTLLLGCAWLARGGNADVVGGLDAARLAALDLPADASDASVVLAALGELLAGSSTRDVVRPHVAARAHQAPCDDQAEAALREIAERLPPGGAELRAVLTRLVRPVWQSVQGGPERADSLRSWLTTMTWLAGLARAPAGRGGPVDAATARLLLAEAAQSSGSASDLLALCLDGRLPGGARGAVDALLPRLRVLYDPPTWATSTVDQRARTLVEVDRLLDSVPEGECEPDAWWQAFVTRSTGAEGAAALHALARPEPRPGVVADGAAPAAAPGWPKFALVARSRLAAHLVKNGPRFLLHDAVLDEAEVLSLVAARDERLARPVAVQLERILRQGSGLDNVRLLWKLLRVDPDAVVFKELTAVLRDKRSKLADLVAMLRRLDELHAMGAADTAIQEIYGGIVDLAKAVAGLADPPHDREDSGGDGSDHESPGAAAPAPLVVERRRRARSPHFGTDQALRDVGSPDWLSAWRSGLFGTGAADGLTAWMAKLDLPLDPALELRWTAFASAAADLFAVRSSPAEDQVTKAGDALADLEAALGQTPWPETLLLQTLLDAARRWVESLRVEARFGVGASLRIREHLDQDDEKALLQALYEDRGDGRERFRGLAKTQLEEVQRFLLRRLAFRAAAQLRIRARPIELPAVQAWIGLLIAGIVAGPMLVLDIGEAWTTAIKNGDAGFNAADATKAWAVSASAVVASLLLVGLVTAGVPLRRAGRPGEKRRVDWDLVRRILALAVGSLALAFVASGLLLASQPGADPGSAHFWLQVGFWTPLSTSLGLFLGLVLQGYRTGGRDG